MTTGAATLAAWTWSPTSTVLVVLGVGLIASVVLPVFNRRRAPGGRSNGPPLSPREQLERMKQERGMRRDLGELAVEIEQLVGRLTKQLDDQSARIEALLRQADERIARLEQLRQDPPGIAPARGTASAPGTPASSGTGVPPVIPSSERPTDAAAPLPMAPTPPPPALPDDPVARRIYQLADAGLEPTDIARKLGEHVGKVELILALRSV